LKRGWVLSIWGLGRIRIPSCNLLAPILGEEVLQFGCRLVESRCRRYPKEAVYMARTTGLPLITPLVVLVAKIRLKDKL
jgi:hypothetical protein